MYLEKINSPADVKKLQISELKALADEVRSAVINRISKYGGHKGPNLGIVETTVALHYVFDSPDDKMVFDVSHQCYPHKILTGRKDAFICDEHFSDVTGYTNPDESEHDFFTVGHTSTSVSLALGLCKGRDISGGNENIIAIIGDGSLSGGQALEALDYAGEYGKNLIIVVNDNDQSIAENHGGMYKTLRKLRETDGKCEENIFKAFGLDYKYLDDGHDMEKLVSLFESVKGINHPVVLHIHTIKGKGLAYAEEKREAFHAGGPFNVSDGSPKFKGNPDTTVTDSLTELLDSNKKAVLLNAGTPGTLGFSQSVRKKYVENGQFIDVGIAEENAVGMISGIAKNGGTAIFGTFAPFLQRTYDQTSHDLCLNNNPATVLVLSAGVFGSNSNTHLALCDIQFYSHIPNLVYLAPSTRNEFRAMLGFATAQKSHPVAIRVPAKFYADGDEDLTDYSKLNKSKVIQKGEGTAIFAIGYLIPMALEAARLYKEKTGKSVTVINPVFLTGLDENLLNELEKNHTKIITLEDGEKDGGFGERISAYYGERPMKVANYGISKHFHSDFDALKLLSENGISVEKIVSYIE